MASAVNICYHPDHVLDAMVFIYSQGLFHCKKTNLITCSAAWAQPATPAAADWPCSRPELRPICAAGNAAPDIH
jgi:hypothetical protein